MKIKITDENLRDLTESIKNWLTSTTRSSYIRAGIIKDVEEILGYNVEFEAKNTNE